MKAQLQKQISNNQDVLTQFESAKSQPQRLLSHKDSKISPLMSEVSSLISDKAWLEERLAALSASPSAEQVPTQAQRSSGNVESQSLSLHDVQAAVSSQLVPVLEALQELSGRMMSYENSMSRNHAEPSQPSQSSQVRLTLPVPSQGSGRTGLVGGGGGPPGPEDLDWVQHVQTLYTHVSSTLLAYDTKIQTLFVDPMLRPKISESNSRLGVVARNVTAATMAS